MTAVVPEVVSLCGSSRLRDVFEREQRRLTLEGRIVISLGFFEQPRGAAAPAADGVDLGELHKREIDLSQRIHVVNVGGHVGRSTRSEIKHAERHGIAVAYMEPRQDRSPTAR
ncbi:hypothetical protein WDV85_07990 [Pseudokineococcus sp. 5B2Z-1]|uniref:hypothetical protein n=1 Tax=Pseudokineococcus sp. 5B2Z-1 TaxID=3132744 RepID=UPI0030B236A1